MPAYWLFKTEPDAFSWDDLLASPEQTTRWDGVRNYQARNLLRDQVAEGDLVLFYHSAQRPPQIVGIARVVRAGYPDPSALDPASPLFDAKSSPEKPRWFVVDVRAERALPTPVRLDAMKANPALAEMTLLRQGRLSVQPVRAEEFDEVLRMGGEG